MELVAGNEIIRNLEEEINDFLIFTLPSEQLATVLSARIMDRLAAGGISLVRLP